MFCQMFNVFNVLIQYVYDQVTWLLSLCLGRIVSLFVAQVSLIVDHKQLACICKCIILAVFIIYLFP